MELTVATVFQGDVMFANSYKNWRKPKMDTESYGVESIIIIPG